MPAYGIPAMMVSGTQGYASVRAAAIHYPPSGYLDDSTRRSALADMPGLRLDKEIALIKNNVRYTTTQRLWQASERLSLRLQNKVMPPQLKLFGAA